MRDRPEKQLFLPQEMRNDGFLPSVYYLSGENLKFHAVFLSSVCLESMPDCFSEDIHNGNINIKKEADYDLLYRLYGSANLLLIPFISSETVLSKILA